MNSRPPVPQTGALTELRYAPPCDIRYLIWRGLATESELPPVCRPETRVPGLSCLRENADRIRRHPSQSARCSTWCRHVESGRPAYRRGDWGAAAVTWFKLNSLVLWQGATQRLAQAIFPCRHIAPARRSMAMALKITRRAVLAITLGLLTAPVLAVAAKAADVTVFAAASLKNALDDAAKIYQTKTGDKVTISYAASSALAKQIKSGAPADIFFSADLDWMDHLQEKKLIDAGSRHTLLGNTLVLVAPKEFDRVAHHREEFPVVASARCGRQARHGSGRQCAGRQIRQGGVDLSRRVGCGGATRGTSRECARRLGLRRPERGAIRDRLRHRCQI